MIEEDRSMKKCTECKFSPLCRPFIEVASLMNEVREATINAWIASDDSAAVYNTQECKEEEEAFSNHRDKALSLLASGCHFYEKKEV